jgi:hypothetical protein
MFRIVCNHRGRCVVWREQRVSDKPRLLSHLEGMGHCTVRRLYGQDEQADLHPVQIQKKYLA